MKNKENELEMFSFDKIKDEFIGEVGTVKRTLYEQELQIEILGDLIKKVRLERNMTQEELGKLIGVQRAQISKLESSANSATIDTILKVFKALKAEINFNVKIEKQMIKLS